MEKQISYQILKEERKVIATIKVGKCELKGVAYCSPQDKFNELIGMEIAKNRALIVLNECEKEIMEEDLKEMKRIIKSSEEIIKNLTNTVKECETDIRHKEMEIENRKRLVRNY